MAFLDQKIYVHGEKKLPCEIVPPTTNIFLSVTHEGVGLSVSLSIIHHYFQ
jgi:hypothetical protein